MSSARIPSATNTSLLFGSFLLLLACMPLPLGSNRPWAWSLLETGVFTLLLFWLVQWGRGKIRVTPALQTARPLIILLGLWLLHGLIQLIPLPESLHVLLLSSTPSMHPVSTQWLPISVDPAATQVELLKSAAYIGIVILTLLLVDSKKRLLILVSLLVLCGAAQALYGSLQALGAGGMGSASGSFVNRNHFAGYLEMTLALGIGLLIARMQSSPARAPRQRLRNLLDLLMSDKLIIRALLLIMVTGLVMSHSRMGNSAFFISLTLTGLLALKALSLPRGKTLSLLLSILIMDILIIGTWFGTDRLMQRLEQTRLETEIRVDISEDLSAMWDLNPVMGSGAGSFYSYFPQYKNSPTLLFFDHAHNDYLEFYIERGVSGMLLLAAIVLLSLRQGLFKLFHSHNSLMAAMGFTATMGILSILIHSLADFNLHIPANAVLFMVLLALPWLNSQNKEQ